MVVSEDFRVPSTERGVEIHVRNKRPEGVARFDEQKVVVFIHGATYPGSMAFDHPMFGGGSWMDYMARHGFDCYLFDVRGYGKSTRSAAMRSATPQRRAPYARTPEAVADLAAVVEFVRQRAGVPRVNLIGWSWGTAVGGGYAALHNDKVRHLTMFAPLWVIRSAPAAMARWMQLAAPLAASAHSFMSAYRTVTRGEMRQRWVSGLDAATAEQVIPKAEYDRWWDALAALEPEPRRGDGVRAPNGVMADLMERWCANKPTYVPEDIRVPTLLLLGEWDVDTPPYMAQELFSKLVAAPYKRLEMLARGTHAMALEINRVDLYRRVREFIDTRYV